MALSAAGDVLEPIALPDAEFRFAPAWLAVDEADALFDALQVQVPWAVHRIRLFGCEVDSPRLNCWIGDPEAVYTYSRARFVPHPWPHARACAAVRMPDMMAVGAPGCADRHLMPQSCSNPSQNMPPSRPLQPLSMNS